MLGQAREMRQAGGRALLIWIKIGPEVRAEDQVTSLRLEGLFLGIVFERQQFEEMKHGLKA